MLKRLADFCSRLRKDGGSNQVGFSGFQRKSLADIIQMECLAQSTCVIRLVSGRETGRIWIQDGSIIDAATPSATGELAVHKILTWRSGRFDLLPGEPSHPRAIDKNIYGLLLEAAQAIDEGYWASEQTVPRPQTADERLRSAAGSRSKQLDLAGLGLQLVPEAVCQLLDLESLDLSNNQLVALPDGLGRLPNLRFLNLARNRLSSLPDSLGELKQLRSLLLHDNPRLGLPVELLGPGPGAADNQDASHTKPAEILDYYFRTRSGVRPLNEGKFILVGRGGVGKTSLVNRLVWRSFNPAETKTDGIGITLWPVKLADDEVQVNIWDFGGQEIMHATHQFFLTERSLYLLVLNGREGTEDSDADYWLRLIESLAGDSKVIVVLNKHDECPFELNYRELQEKFPRIGAFVKTDCRTLKGVEALRAEVHRHLAAMDGIRARFPGTWFAIKSKLATMSDNYLDYSAFRNLCRQNGEPDEKAQDELSSILHCLGIALNYRDDVRLRETSVLNPRWVTAGIYGILTHGKLAAQEGVLTLENLAGWLPEEDYPRDKHAFILDLMRKFRLCFPFPDDPGNRYLVPELLPKGEPDLASEFLPRECLSFEYHYPILPEGLLPQFIVRTYVLSEGHPRWRSGVVLEWDNARALVKADVAEKCVLIRVRAPSPEGARRLLAIIRWDFERIHAGIPNLAVQARVPLADHPQIARDYDELLVFEQKGIRHFPIRIGNEVLAGDVQKLLSGVELARSAGGSASGPAVAKPCRLFFCYAHKDEALRDQLETHLKLLQREGLVAAWHDRRISAGQTWQHEISEHLEAADIVLLLVSASFLASDYCYDLELKRALARAASGEAAVVPVVLRPCDWHSAPFARMQALPKDGRAITLWKNRDAAWADVADGIRRLVLKRGA